MFLWGSNAREAHPIWFHHLLKGIRNGARLYVIDPRRTASAQWADVWLGLNVGSDIALANAMAREIIHAGLARRGVHRERDRRASTRIARRSSRTRSEFGERTTGIPADVIREAAHAYARADKAMVCWTLGITEHHNAVDNVLALINLCAAHRPRRPLGLRLQSAARPEQRAGRRRHGRDSEQAARLPGHRAGSTTARARIRARTGARTIQPTYGLEPHADAARDVATRADGAVRHRREPGAVGRGRASRRGRARGPRSPRRAGDLPHADGGARARRAARGGDVVRRRRHGHEQRAPRAAGPQGDRAARRCARRAVDHLARSRAAWATTGARRPPKRCGTSSASSRRSSPAA